MREVTTIIMPVFNGEEFIEDAINSVLNQTYKEIELIIVNDGSTDNTEVILERYKNIDNIEIIGYSENKGKVHALNMGYSHMRGKYIVLLAADDVLTKDSIEERVKSINGYDFAFCKIYKCDNNLNVKKTLYNYPVDSRFEWEDYYSKVAWGNIIGGGSLIITKQIADKIFPIPEELEFEDWWITFTGLFYSKSIYFLNKPLLLYRIHDSNDNGHLSNKSISKRIKKDYRRHIAYYLALDKFVKENVTEDREQLLTTLKMNCEFKKSVINSELIPWNKRFIKLYGVKRYLFNNLISKNMIDVPFKFLNKLTNL